MAIVIESISAWQEIQKGLKKAHRTIGFVPTMGALHEGHLSLIRRCRAENDIVVASIFVNPTQFNNSDDLKTYPKTFEEDRKKLESYGCNTDYIIFPQYRDLYPDDYTYVVSEKKISKILCGAHRPGHFDGVLSVVMKLLNIVRADNAYFGEKDYQQFLLIKGMVEAYFMDVNIVGCKTVREEDGLAMSSRNLNLTPKERAKAPEFFRELNTKIPVTEVVANLTKKGFKVDYVEEHYGHRFGAVFLGRVRLIDNVKIQD